MSSICGLLHRDGRPASAGEVKRMVEVLAHSEPNGSGIWHAEAAAMGLVARWTTPEAVGECGPLVDAASGVVVTADARLDNRDELIAALGGEASGAMRDAELIARAYLKWSEACVDHLVGDFAFALWDARRRRFFCARDAMGVRPFFYFLDGRDFIFGSEIKALFTASKVPRERNDLQLARALAGLPSFDDQTAFRAVRALEPAAALTVDAGGVRVWKYWRLELEREIALPSDDDYVDVFEDVLRRAIKARLRTNDGRVGGLLSGGLDATTALALAMQSGPPSDAFSAFSWALPPGDDWWVPDERRYIEAFLRRHPVDHAYIMMEPAHLMDFPPEMARFRDGPEWRVDHCQFLPTFAEARRRGVRVLLHGVSGDETVSYAGLDFPLWCLLSGDWPALNAEAKGIAAENRVNRLRALPKVFAPWMDRRRLRTPFTYQWRYRSWCDRADDLSDRKIPLRSDVASATALAEYVQEAARPRLTKAWRNPLRADQIYVLTQTHVVSDQIAAWDYAAAFGLECRFPYLDRRVVEFAVAVPPRQHRYGGLGRRLLRRVARRNIPTEIAGRRDKSPTMPDLSRAIAVHARGYFERIEAWRSDREVAALVDLDQMAANLRSVIAAVEGRSPEWVPVLPFCRGMLLGMHLQKSAL